MNKQIRHRESYGPWPTSIEIFDNGCILHWNKIYKDQRGIRRLPITCPICKCRRILEAAKARGKSRVTFTGVCDSCHRKSFTKRFALRRHAQHPAWKGGSFISGGYRHIQFSVLPDDALDIVRSMGRKIWKDSYSISEHRLNMALHLQRPLKRSEIVHHKNGDKLDNRIENLEITSHAKHRQLDVKYYNLWQEALQEIEKLESELLKYSNSDK